MLKSELQSDRKEPEGLSLELYKSNSHVFGFNCGIGTFHGVQDLGDGRFKSVNGAVRCNRWACPVCRIVKAKKIYKRCMNGKIGNYNGRDGFRSRYEVKMLTLTPPGQAYRESHSFEECYIKMRQDLDKLLRATNKKYGDFLYVCVVEKFKDGFPHFHLILVGRNIIPSSIYSYMDNLWRSKYGQGFTQISLGAGRNKKNNRNGSRDFKSSKHALSYALKYLKKDPAKFTKFSRPFSNSQDALESLPPKIAWVGYSFKSSIVPLSSGQKQIIELGFNSLWDLEEYLDKYGLLHSECDYLFAKDGFDRSSPESLKKQENNFNEVMDYFSEIASGNKMVQLRLY